MGACDKNITIPITKGGDGSFRVYYTKVSCNRDADGNLISEPVELKNGYEIYVDFISPKTGQILKTCSIEDGIILLKSPGLYVIDPGSTLKWPVCTMAVDILYINKGVGRHTDRFFIEIKPNITRTMAR